MRISKKIISCLIVAALLLTFAVANLGLNFASAAEVTVEEYEIFDMFNWQDKDSSVTKWSPDGAVASRAYNANTPKDAGIGLKRQFDISNGNEVKLTFRIPILDHATRTVRPNMMNINDSARSEFRVYFRNVETREQCALTFFLSGNLATNELATCIALYDFNGDVEDENQWIGYVMNDWIYGVATDASSFTIGFNTTDFIKINKARTGYGEYGVSTYGAPYYKYEDGRDPTEITKTAQDVLSGIFADCETLEIYFGPQRIIENERFEVVIMDVNGQSLSCVDGKINDTVAPVVPDIKEAEAGVEISVNNAFSIACKEWLDDRIGDALLYVNPAYDVITGGELTFKLKVTTPNGLTDYCGEYDDALKQIKNIKFTTAGEYKLVVEAIDNAGNIGYSRQYTANVVKGFEIVKNGNVPLEANKGSKITLPSAIATDKNNVQHAVTITVNDPMGVKVTLDANNSFTPNRLGKYYVTYQSSYDDNGTTRTTTEKLTIKVVASGANAGTGVGGGSGSTGGAGGGCNATIQGSTVKIILIVMACALVGLLVVKKIIQYRKGA